MATFYSGHRSVLKGRNWNDAVHTWKGTAGTYSNWSLFNSSHVLDGAPNNDHVPGTGYHPHGLTMSRWFMGADSDEATPSTWGHTDDQRFRPLENKAAGNNLVFKASYGHVQRFNDYNFDEYGEEDRWPQLSDPGHTSRGIDEGEAPFSFGAFAPFVYKGVDQTLSDAGQSLPDSATASDLGHNRINEWRGVTSTKALDI